MEKARLDIIAGFLGAGKTTLLRQLLGSADADLRIAVCENEYGEVSLDGLALKDDRFELMELNAGCICCTLGPALQAGLKMLCARFHPQRILLEPTGLASLADIRMQLDDPGIHKVLDVGAAVAVISGQAYAHDMPRFERYYGDLIASASCVCLNRTQDMPEDAREQLQAMIVERNFDVQVLEDPQDGNEIWAAMERSTLPPVGEPQPRKWLSTFKDAAVPTDWPSSRERLEAFFAGNPQCGDILRAKGFVRDGDGVWWHADYAGGSLRFEMAYGQTVPWMQFIGRNLAVSKLKAFFTPVG